MARKTVTKKARFEVFKRDKFTCQYCGRKVPDVVLQIDHIEPVAKGGGNEILNLISACQECNSGKGARALDDQSAVERQRKQLEDLEERRQQIGMMVEWQRGLLEMDVTTRSAARDYWTEMTGWDLNDMGQNTLRQIVGKYGLDAVLRAMRECGQRNMRRDSEGKVTQDSVEFTWKRVRSTLYAETLSEEDRASPEQQSRYVRGIIRNRFHYHHPKNAMSLLLKAFALGASFDEMKELAASARNWTDWRERMEEQFGPQTDD